MSAPLWSSDEAAAATGGRCDHPWRATGVSIDSRTIAADALFVALQGPTFDGHAFVADALQRGAAAAVVARRPDGIAADAPLLVVSDTFAALQDLGRAARARCRGRIAAVTGSVGKTGVKEALRLVLGGQGRVAASDGSFNNHWGVPLSLARTAPDCDYAVFEIGMNHAGEITPLTRQVRPHVAAITTVEAVHRENFPSVEAIADAKAEIFAGVEPEGAVVLNHDNPYFARLVRHAEAAGIERVLSFGSAAADVRLLDAEPDALGTEVRAHVVGRTIRFRVGVPGRHWVGNALCVLACAYALGADPERAAADLARLTPPKGRGMRRRIPVPGGAFELIDDSYNASPPSVAAACEVLCRSRPGAGGRRIAVLGDMLELGEESARLHAGLVRPLLDNDVDLVFTAGPLMAHLHAALPAERRGGHAETSAALAPIVARAVRSGDVVTVKGSAGSRMRLVVEALAAPMVETAGDPGSAPAAEG